jgi:vacuolar protein sorting-associated protein 13A/C
MVLESLAASLLEKYLGQYVSGFQKDNLKFSLSSGNAVLENLELKKEALDDLELPITVKAGKGVKFMFHSYLKAVLGN